MAKADFQGVLVPAITPFDARLEPDAPLCLKTCRWLLGQGAHGLAVFGTTSEANSMSLHERKALLEGLVEGGINPSLLLPGTGQPALPDTVELTRHAVSLGCGGVLMLPPFYYKPVRGAPEPSRSPPASAPRGARGPRRDPLRRALPRWRALAPGGADRPL